MVEWVHHMLLMAKYTAIKEDKPNYWEATSGPFAGEYWKSAHTEIETLEKMEAWYVVERYDAIKLIESTWSFNLKQFLDVLIKKFKSWFCAWGN